MPRICSICTHLERISIDKALAHHEASQRSIAAQYGVARTSMRRHERRCLDPKLIEAAAKTENAEAKRLVNRVDRIVTRLEKRCEESDSWQQTDSWLKIIRELRPYHELYGRASQELANDKVQGLLIELGVRTADEAKNLVALSRVGAQLSLAEVKAEWEQATRFLLAEGAVNVQDVQRIVGQASYAVELTNGNGEPH